MVLGASDNPESYSFLTINRLVESGYPIFAIGKRETEDEDVKIIETTGYFL